VGQYLFDGLAAEANTLVIATPEHLDGISRHLLKAGVEVNALIKAGRYTTVNAVELLPKLLIDGVPSAMMFERHITSLVARLTAGGQKLCAFGELVALLCAEGKPDSAIQLEALWNALAERFSFDLLCGYPMKHFADASSSEPFLRVCQAHTHVLPTEHFVTGNQSSGEPLLTIAILQQKAAALETEVAARQRSDQSLRRREAEFTQLADATVVPLHWVDENGTILWANRAELSLLGYPIDEYVGRNLAEFHVDRKEADDILTLIRQRKDVQNHEARLRCRDGSIKTVLIDSIGVWRDDEYVHTHCFTRDITEQRSAELASRHLAAIVESSDDAILSKDLNGVITSWNRGAERIFGYTADETVGRPVTILIPPDRLREEVEILARLRRGERVDHFETLRRCKDGRLLNVSLTISPVLDSRGRIVGASKIARDITEKKRAEAALKIARDQLSRTNEELERRVHERTESLREAIAQLEEFSYTVSHDLRAPLRGMQVYSQALLEDHGPTLDAEARHCLKRIAENATRLDKMVMDVLTFSRISRADLRMERVHLDRLVREIIHHYPSMQPPQAIIDVAPLDDVWGHEPSLTQIISNLLSNAVKFVAPGVVPAIRIWTNATDASVRLFVRDNGIGIHPDRHNRLFRMFERLHPDLPYEGTGVGLAIVRKAAVRMGGEVGIESNPGAGTTFWVQLPAPKGTVE
jgi:PAS domain S-box-containing protein